MNHIVEMPEHYLLAIATHGNMGDGELSDFMQMWAEKECARLGLSEVLQREKSAKYQKTLARARKILGSDTVDAIEKLAPAIARVTDAVIEARKK